MHIHFWFEGKYLRSSVYPVHVFDCDLRVELRIKVAIARGKTHRTGDGVVKLHPFYGMRLHATEEA